LKRVCTEERKNILMKSWSNVFHRVITLLQIQSQFTLKHLRENSFMVRHRRVQIHSESLAVSHNQLLTPKLYKDLKATSIFQEKRLCIIKCVALVN